MSPFSKRAKAWEPIALDLRQVAKVKLHERLDPWLLAPEVGLRVLDSQIAFSDLSSEMRLHLLGTGKNKWSGGVYPYPLPDGTLLCILNPAHSRRRNKITLMEEISHNFQDHAPSGVTYTADGLKFRDYNKTQEEEAYGIGAAALLPWQTFFYAVNAGKTRDELSEMYDVTTDLIEYRIKVTGAYYLYRSRQRK